MNFFKSLYIAPLFFVLIIADIILFVLSYPYPVLFKISFGGAPVDIALFPIAIAGLIVTLVLLFLDVFILYLSGKNVRAKRKVSPTLSLGDEYEVSIRIENNLALPINIQVIDEAPYQLQLRDLIMYTSADPGEVVIVTYKIFPTERGKFQFGDIVLFAQTALRQVQRKIVIPSEKMIAVYPSVLQMKKYELKVFNKLNLSEGIKKVRRLGHSTDYEQIKNYVVGDDYRRINWKATSRKSELMVNQYEDEKAQQVYSIIDKSRSMRMPFNNMTLLDYAINSSLVISNIALRKSDRAGVLTFSDKLGSRLPAERNAVQLKKILDLLYRQQTKFNEANFELLYTGIRSLIKGRSLLLLYTNFESYYAMERALPLLRRINQQHLLVVIFFENTELEAAGAEEAKTLKEIYRQTIIKKLAHEKSIIVQELKRHAIQAILTTPENLSVDTINKYLELKSRGLI